MASILMLSNQIRSLLLPRLVLPLLALVFVAAPALAQTEWSIEGSLPSYGEYTAPPPPCLVPPAPYAVNLPPTPPAGCPANLPFAPGSCQLGGTAFDNDGNLVSGGPTVPVVINSDGFTLEVTTPAGLYITSMPVPVGSILPGPITGVACDSKADMIWITDGVFAAAVAFAPACPTPPVIIPAFAIPPISGVIHDALGWDPCTGTLWAADCTGTVTNYAVGGAFLGFFSVPGVAVTGLSINTTNGNVQITDGISFYEYTPGGILAPPGPFYLTSNPYPIPLWAAMVSGLAFSLRPVAYGTGCSPSGTPPSIGWGGGYPWAGNSGFTLVESGATAGANALLVWGFAPTCPGIPVGGCPGGKLWVSPGGFAAVGTVPTGGTLIVPAPIPFAAPCVIPPNGVTIFVQFVNILGSSGLELTDSLSFTIGSL